MNEERITEFLFDFPLRRAENFLKFAEENPGVVWPSFIEEFEEVKEVLEKRIESI
jgi:hypothetical protein